MSPSRSCDFAVIGGGIAGASAAHALQARGPTVLLERESVPGYHTTGRSAAFVVESYGSAVVQRLTSGGRSFLEKPPEGFSDHPLVEPCPVIWIARPDQTQRLDSAQQRWRNADTSIQALEIAEAERICPVLRPGYAARALIEPGALSIDVAGLLDAFLRGFRARGGSVETRAPVRSIQRSGSGWEVHAGELVLHAAVVVNAAGAWCDAVAALAGARPLGMRPLRRTAITFDPPAGCDPRSWPCVIDADEEFYFKPEGRRILASPCDETPSDPCDAIPDDYGVALAAERVERATTMKIKHIRSSWAGLRTFSPDRSPVIGMDPERPGFFWLAGQGGFGIMTSPAASQAAASLIVDGRLPAELASLGLTSEQLSPARFAR